MPRSGKAWAPEMRKRIQERVDAGQIAERLVDHILSDGDLMTTSQIAAANILLKKVIPDLKALEHSLDPDSGPLAVNVIQYANSNAPK